MISVGIIGAGIISKAHVNAIKAHGGSKIQAVADIVLERAQAIADEWGANAYADYVEMLDKEKLDIVIVNLPHALHEPCVLACAARKVNVLLEKPMSVSEESCKRMVAACQEAGVLLKVGHVQRYDPANRAAREIIESGELGQLVMVHDMRSANYFVPTRPKWFLKKETAGGGIWINLGAHCLDKLCYLTGSTIESINGQCTWLQEGVDVDGSAQAFVKTKSGVSGVISLCGYSLAPSNETQILLTKGSIRLVTSGSVTVYQNGETREVDISRFPSMFTAQWEDVVKSLECGQVINNDGVYAGHIIRNIEALWK